MNLSTIETTFLVLAILGIALSSIFFWRSKRQREPRYKSATFSLIKGGVSEIRGLEVSFMGKPQDDVKVSLFSIWNAGREPIRDTDNAIEDPVRIIAKGDAKIFASQLKNTTNTVNAFQVIEPKYPATEILVSFDFFSRQQGATIAVYHSGLVSLTGTIIGADKIIYAHDDPYSDRLTSWTSRPPFSWIDQLPPPIAFVFFFPMIIIILLCVLVGGFMDSVSRPFRLPPKALVLKNDI